MLNNASQTGKLCNKMDVIQQKLEKTLAIYIKWYYSCFQIPVFSLIFYNAMLAKINKILKVVVISM